MKSSSLIGAAVIGLTAACSSVKPSLTTPPHSAAVSTARHAGVRVAVFAEPGFPFYMASSLISPASLARDLKKVGVQVELLDAAALADPAKLNARVYAAVVLPYGNSYPQEAFANLKTFHRAGGSLILTGVPFTHPAERLSAANWSPSPDWGESLHLVPQAHTGRRALVLTGRAGNWVGVSSAPHSVHPGAAVTVSGWVQDVRGVDRGDDWIFIRFNKRGGEFLSQTGARINLGTGWRQLRAEIAAPAGAATFDISPQVRSAGRVVRVDDLDVKVDGRSLPLPNAGFENPGHAWTDLGHHPDPPLFGPTGIGVGGFAGGPQAPVVIAPGDPLGIRALGRNWRLGDHLQVLDTSTIPAEDLVTPILLEGDKPVAALVLHRDAMFKGAIDVWTHHPDTGGYDAYDTEQMLVRGTVAVLTKKGILTTRQQKLAFASMDKLPRPMVYANLVLPTPPRPYPTFQPKMPPPAARLYVADVRSLQPAQRRLLVSLQGIVNRRQPRIYLLLGEDDPFWLDQMQKQGRTGAPIPVSNPMSLVSMFRGEIKGAVIPDPKVYVSPDVAVDIAGLEDLVIATPELALQLKLPVKSDLRGKFHDNADALRYVRTTLLPRLNPYLSICLDPPLLDGGAIDQIIAARGMAFWVTGPKAQDRPGANMGAERAEIEATFAKLPLNAVVRGFWWHGEGVGLDEGPGVSLGSRFGKVTVVSDYVDNYSVFSGFPLASLKQKAHPPAPRLDRSRVYLAITMSDGDNLSTWRGYFRRYFTDPLHGTFPVGWGMGPTLIDCAPVMAQWYYDHAAPTDEFLCDVSGVGYIYPPDWATSLKDRDGALKSFYNWTEQYMKRMDMKTVRLMNVRTEDIPRVGADLPGISFLMPDYGYAGERSYNQLTYSLPTRQAVFRAIMSGSGPQNLADQVRRRAGATRPAFVNAFVWNWGSKLSDLKQMLDLLGPEYVAVTPSQLYALYQQASR